MNEEDVLCRWTAQRIAEGKVVGWFQGRMEWGLAPLVIGVFWPIAGALICARLSILAEDLVRDYNGHVSVVAGRPLLGEKADRWDARLWWPVRREIRNGVQILRAGGGAPCGRAGLPPGPRMM